jgi:hypothetical protein
MSKTMQILAFLAEPRTHRDIAERFGHFAALLDNLVASGAARKFIGANERAGDKWQRVAVRHYVATGLPYDTSKLPKRVRSCLEKEKHREYMREYNRKTRELRNDAAPSSRDAEMETLRDENERLRVTIENQRIRLAQAEARSE